MGGFLTEEAALVTLKASKLTDQVCLKSESALSLLRFLETIVIKDGTVNG
jgi:hypothetical protein